MGKTRQPELVFEDKLIGDLTAQGFWVKKVCDRFRAGMPDLRVGRRDTGQMDFELKYCTLTTPLLKECDTGLSKLQWLKLREMNSFGIPSVGLIWLEALEQFRVTNVLRAVLPLLPHRVIPRPGSVIDGAELFKVARGYLDELGTEPAPRVWK